VRRRSARRGTCAFWFLLGGLLGAFGVGYAWMIHEPTASGPGSEQATTRPPANPPQERTFDFYSLLPEEEVLVPAQEEDAAPPALPAPPSRSDQPAAETTAPRATPREPPRPASNAAPGTPASDGSSRYVLQLGSFRSSADAERLRARLALKGLQTSIQTVTIDSGQTYHRVRTARYEKSEAEAMRATLADEGQESIMIRAR
jgi:cell division protein FtsN